MTAPLSGGKRRSARLGEAADWKVLLERQAVTTDELRAFRRWKRDPRNAAAFAEVESAWAQAGALRSDPKIARATAAILDRPATNSSLRARIANRPFVAAAACVLILVVLTATWPLLAGKSYAAGIGEQRRIQLADGSRLVLDADSAVIVRISSSARTVQLKRGRALFDVAHDARRPFSVSADGIETRALGTRFAVSSRGSAVAVTLVQGSVEVRSQRGEAHASWQLTPGQQFIGERDRRARIIPADVAAATGWMEGRLAFRDKPLADAVEEVNRYSRTKVVLASPELADLRVSGFFDAGDTASFAAGVAEMFELRIRRGDDGSMVLTR